MKVCKWFLALSFVFVLTGFSAWAQKGAKPKFVPGEVIVKLKGESQSITSHAFIGKATADKYMSLRGSFKKLNVYHFSLKPGQDVEQMVQELSDDPSVEYAEPNYYLYKSDIGDEIERFELDEVLERESTSSYMEGVLNKIHVTEARLAMSEDVNEKPIVAVIDTGVDYSHYVFSESGAMWINEKEIADNGIDDDKNGFIDDVMGWNFYDNSADPMDDDGHGTHVAGIVLGVGQDIFASQMEEAKIRIMPLKFLGLGGVGTTSAAIKAIYYAINNGAQVLNNSWGGSDYSSSLLEAVVETYNEKRVFVAASGNNGQNNDVIPIYPASYDVPHLISIAAINSWDSLASFSNYGLSSVDIAAPGVSILSTMPGGTFGYSSGTSMSSPFVAGITALMLREASDLNGYEVKSILFSAGEKVNDLLNKTVTSSKVNALSSVELSKTSASNDYQPDYNVTYSAGVREPSSMAGGCGLVSLLGKGKGGKGGGIPGIALLALILLIPILLIRYFRFKAQNLNASDQRRYERFQIDSKVSIDFGGRELLGSVSSISMGGVRLDTDALLEQGGIVSMKISSPDGTEQIEVQGKIVWSEPNKSYGVQFDQAQEGIRSAISNWTKSLGKAAG